MAVDVGGSAAEDLIIRQSTGGIYGHRGAGCRVAHTDWVGEMLAVNAFILWSDLSEELAPHCHLLDLHDLSSHAEFVLSQQVT